jgi:hypothetical protein
VLPTIAAPRLAHLNGETLLSFINLAPADPRRKDAFSSNVSLQFPATAFGNGKDRSSSISVRARYSEVRKQREWVCSPHERSGRRRTLCLVTTVERPLIAANSELFRVT